MRKSECAIEQCDADLVRERCILGQVGIHLIGKTVPTPRGASLGCYGTLLSCAASRARGPNRKFQLTGILDSNAFAHLSNLKVESMGRKYLW